LRGIEILPQWDPCPHADPPICGVAIESDAVPLGNPPNESQLSAAGIRSIVGQVMVVGRENVLCVRSSVISGWTRTAPVVAIVIPTLAGFREVVEIEN
ncbi:MAG: hypothetical protein OXE57_12605, partial [Alphaproteobacteria bacterium]|nr:hypothetical protein [Alphaproteobacteria bacterium]